LPTIPFIVFTIGLLAALMGSADSAMLIPSTMVVKNLPPMIKRDVGEKTRLLLAKILVPVFTLVSLYIALYTKTIYFLINLSWELILMVQGTPFILRNILEESSQRRSISRYSGKYSIMDSSNTIHSTPDPSSRRRTRVGYMGLNIHSNTTSSTTRANSVYSSINSKNKEKVMMISKLSSVYITTMFLLF